MYDVFYVKRGIHCTYSTLNFINFTTFVTSNLAVNVAIYILLMKINCFGLKM